MRERRDRLYHRICAEMGYPRRGDRLARDYLARRIGEAAVLPDLRAAAVTVCGAGPSLSDELHQLDQADAVVTASTATDIVAAAGYPIDLMVTDLDKNPETAVRLTTEGVPVAVHAHGDNLELLRRWLPRCDQRWVIPTTQAGAIAAVMNPGGFTDGDRAAFLADRAGAAALSFIGWDLDDASVDADKRAKLRWAAVALLLLGAERGEEYGWIDATDPAVAARWGQVR
jgi:hypothetical protein